MVLTTPLKMRTTLSAKNAYALVHTRICNGAEASLPWKLLRTYLESCANIVQAVVCRSLLPPLLLSRPNPSPDAVHSRNPSKSTLAHDAVATAVSHKHHSIVRVGAGLTQFVYGSHSRLATELIRQRILFLPWFSRAFSDKQHRTEHVQTGARHVQTEGVGGTWGLITKKMVSRSCHVRRAVRPELNPLCQCTRVARL